jgi:hypothetical protein
MSKENWSVDDILKSDMSNAAKNGILLRLVGVKEEEEEDAVAAETKADNDADFFSEENLKKARDEMLPKEIAEADKLAKTFVKELLESPKEHVRECFAKYGKYEPIAPANAGNSPLKVATTKEAIYAWFAQYGINRDRLNIHGGSFTWTIKLKPKKTDEDEDSD